MSNDTPSQFPQEQQPLTNAAGEALRMSWVQPPGIIGLCFKNFLLRIVTLGIYQFWGKTEVRKRVWSAARINGEPLQYTGTGKELFLGFLFVLVVLTVPTLLLSILAMLAIGERGAEIAQGAATILFFYLIGVGTHRAMRYRLSRTLWRGIRGGLEGSSWQYGWTYFWTGVVLLLTLGWASPWRATKLQNLITNDMRFGNRPFRFTATSGPLYGPFCALWLCAVAIILIVGATIWFSYRSAMGGVIVPAPGQRVDPVLVFKLIALLYGGLLVGFLLFAIVSAWYRARLMNHFAAHTSFEDARFSATATGRSLIWLTLTNTLMVIFTLGLLSPLAQARSARYFVTRLALEGSASLDTILQRAEGSSRGEGLAQAFDIDAF